MMGVFCFLGAVQEEQKTTTVSGKKVLVATVLAAGVALGISSSSTGQAFALTNPVANGAIENAQSAAGDAVNETKRRVADGIFGKKMSLADKPRSSSSGSSSALEDAKARVQDFGNKSQNPIATNVEKAAKETEGLGSLGEKSGSAIANRELLGQDSSRVDAATNKAENLVTEFQKKAGDAVDDVKQILSKAQEATSPAAPDVQGSINAGVQVRREHMHMHKNPKQTLFTKTLTTLFLPQKSSSFHRNPKIPTKTLTTTLFLPSLKTLRTLFLSQKALLSFTFFLLCHRKLTLQIFFLATRNLTSHIFFAIRTNFLEP
jgi:hypothetical protein